MARRPRTTDTDSNSAKRGRGRPKKQKPDFSNVNPDAVAKYFTEYGGYMRDMARLSQRIATMLDRAEKTDGIDRKALKRAHKLSMQDPAVVAQERAREAEYLAILGIVEEDEDGQVGLSADFAPPAKKKPTMEAQVLLDRARAQTDGYNTGLAGGDLNHNRHEPGTQLHQEWVIGFHDGHADRLMKNPDADKITVASDKRKRKEPTPPPADEGQSDLEDAVTAALANVDAPTGAQSEAA